MDRLHTYLKSIWSKIHRPSKEPPEQEKGQSIVLLAIMIIILLLFAGLALDSGLIYMRRVQLTRAVDAAALACVTELPDMDNTENRASQFMRANGLDPTTVLIASGGTFTVNQELPPNVEEYEVVVNHIATVDATWRSKTVFMQLIGIPFVDLSATATAEYRAYIDMYTSQTNESGKLGPVNMSIFGPLQSPSFGDAYTSEWQLTKQTSSCTDPDPYDPRYPHTSSPHDGSSTYNAAGDSCHIENPYYGKFQNGYPFRINIPAHVTGIVRVEILDPETHNADPSSTILISRTARITKTFAIGSGSYVWKDDAENSGAGDGNNDYEQAQMRKTDAFAIDRYEVLKNPHNVYSPPDLPDPNRFWFVRMDENRVYNATPSSYNKDYNTKTDFRLYYNSESGKTYIAKYTAPNDNSHNTDMTWVCPGGSALQDPSAGVSGYGSFPASFEVDMDSLTDIIRAEDNSRSLYLEVQATSGYSENGFDLWAGPATSDNVNYWGGERANVNVRNVWIDKQRYDGVLYPHNADGIVVFGRGVLPLNVNHSTMYTVTLAYIPPVAAGIDICVYHWDTDVGGDSIFYSFEDYPGETEGELSEGNSWGPPWNDGNDLALGCDLVSVPDDFVGGFLYARYKMGGQDTSVWRLEYQSPVGDSFVRLIN